MTAQVENVNRVMPDTWPTIYGDEHGRGAATREWVFEDWCEKYNGFDSLQRSHGWRIDLLNPGARMGGDYDFSEVTHCLPTLLDVTLSCHHKWWEVRDEGLDPCQCVGGECHRGACLYCDWESENTATEREAIELANDHAWPGWRELPIVRDKPADLGGKKSKEAIHRWAVEINALLPPGWLEQGGPIRVNRLRQHRLHTPNGTSFGGYSMGVPLPVGDDETDDEED